MNMINPHVDVSNTVTGLVSVVIPAYNHAHFLKEALKSVIDQTYTHWEAIIIDNHSTDDTKSVVNGYKDPRIKLMQIHNNGVIAASRNKGIQNARGQWVAFLDSDDWWHPEKLERSIEVLNEGAQVVCHGEQWVRNGTVIRTVKYRPHETASYRYLLFRKNRLSTSATTVARDCLIRVGGFTEDRRAIGVEDYHLWLKLAKAECKLKFIEQVLGYYRLYGSSQSSTLLRQVKSERWVLEDHFKGLGHLTYTDHIRCLHRLGRLYASTAVRWISRNIS